MDEKTWTIGIRFGPCPEDIAEVIYDILLEDLSARGLDYEPHSPELGGLREIQEDIAADGET